MMRPSISVYLALVLLPLCVANPNNWYYATSADTCGQENCPPANWWRFHTCYEQKCEYHLQPWFPALILVIACAIVSSLVSCLVRTLCCCCECGRNPRSAHYYA